jgi:hypothetical protein
MSADTAEVCEVFEEELWREQLRKLSTNFESTKWQIGDLVVQADSHFPRVDPEQIYGHTIPAHDVYIEAEHVTGLSRALLYDLASTARRCPASVRTEKLSWSHHRIVVNFIGEGADEARIKEWLDRAVNGQLTTRALKREMKTGCVAAVLEKRFQVIVPLRVWETLKAFADLKRSTPQKVAADWLVEKSEASQDEKSDANEEVNRRRKKIRQQVGRWVARHYNPLRLDMS